MPPVFALLSLSPPTQGADALNPKTQPVHISLAENIMAHMTGSPVAAVNPRTVKCESLVAALICGLASA